METKSYKNWWIFLIYGILAIIFGIIALDNPIATLDVLILYFGILLIAGGFFQSIGAIIHSKTKSWFFLLFEGILNILLGILIISFPLLAMEMFVLFVGIWMFINGFSQLVTVFGVKHGIPHKGLIIINGILGVILGFVLIINPFAGTFALSYLVGWSAILLGIFMIVRSISFQKSK